MGYLDELKNGFTITDEYKSDKILNDLKKKNGIDRWESITLKYNTNGELVENKFQAIVHDYHNILKDNKLIDFDQILYYSNVLLIKYPYIPKVLNGIFQCICVDEYQDTQELQYEILSTILKVKDCRVKLFMVGDIDQAIYSSIGGVAKTANEIKTQFNLDTLVQKELSGNYRSKQQIIDFYRNFQSSSIKIESLCEYAKEPAIITFDNTINVNDLEKKIAELISKYLKEGIAENEICVLAPQWYLIIPMGRKLRNLLPNVNFDAIGLSPLCRNVENVWFKIARLFLLDPSSRMISTRRRWASELINEFQNLSIDLFPGLDLKSKRLLRTINSIKSTKTEGIEYLEECFNIFLNKINIQLNDNLTLKEHWNYFFESTRARLEDLELQHASDLESFKKMFKHRNGIVVTTCHGVKGEEFKVVIAFGLLQGYLPNWKEPNKESSALKLLYVICSRAKHNLHLISETGRRTKGKFPKPYTPTETLLKVKYTYNNN